MRYIFLFLVLLSCWRDDAFAIRSFDVCPLPHFSIVVVKKQKETIKMPNVFSFVTESVQRIVTFEAKQLIEQEEFCYNGVYLLRNDWLTSFCDPLGLEAKKECIEQRMATRGYVKELCLFVVRESFYRNFDPLLVISIIKNESDFGTIKERNDHSYYVSQNVCERSIKKRNVVNIENNCRQRRAMRVTFKSGNSICVRIISEDDKGYTINSCLSGEAGVLQIISPNYYAGRIIPETNETIPDVLMGDRRAFINDNLEASIKIGIDELIRHRNIFPERDHALFFNWIAAYNVGGTDKERDQWRKYTRKIFNNYEILCSNDDISSYFFLRCNYLNLFGDD